jgi:cell fate regulator YaaT (PSP1 superfamily)
MTDIEENINNEKTTAEPDTSPPFAMGDEEATPATTRLVKVKFRPAGRHYDFAAGSIPLTKGDRVVVETERGRALGTVVTFARQVVDKDLPEGLKVVLRLAGSDDLAMAANFNAKEEFALRFCRERIAERKMAMKLVRAEYLFDGSKIIFYFTADGRIDFRELVKDLAHHFHTRIEMRQIGVRDEAKLIGGIGICGRELCCSSYLTEFAPVSVKMAKEQELALNPNKISGQCGRLLCCLAYEYETYCDMKKGLPKCGRKVTVEGREGEVISQHILRQTVTVNFGPQQRIEMTAEEVEKGIMPQKLAAAGSAAPERPERPERASGQVAPPRPPERQNRDSRPQRQRPGGSPPETKAQPPQPAARPQGSARQQPASRQNRPAAPVTPEVKAPAQPPQQQIKRVTEPAEGSAPGEQEARRRRQRNRRRSNRKPGAPTTNESGE